MATLHFNTDVGRETVAAIAAANSNIESELNNLKSRVSTLVGAEWQGQSALQFQDEFMTWSSQLHSFMETLTTLQERLNTEIQNWEAIASQF